MDSELLRSVRDYCARTTGAKLLDEDESDRLRRFVASRFRVSETQIWWWEAIRDEAVSMPYRNGDDGIELLHRLLPDGTRPLWLFITDDDPPPWPCVSGDATTLLEMLREQRFFEYFVVDTEVRWIVFDTHHNELIGFGEGFSPK